MYWPKSNANLNLVAFMWQFVSNREIGSLHLLHASGTMLNNCLCISNLGLLHLGYLSAYRHYFYPYRHTL